MTLFGCFEISQRIVQCRGLRQTGQQRALCQIEFTRRLAKVHLRRRLKTNGEIAVICFVEIQRQYVVFAKLLRDAPRQNAFTQFARQRALRPFIGREQQVARELLRDGAAAR